MSPPIRPEAVRAVPKLATSVGFDIAQPPEDILVLVFLHLPLRARIVSTHVCHVWRKIALNTALLWTDLTFDTDRMRNGARPLLARSKAAPVDVCVVQSWWPLSAPDPVFVALAPHLGRLRSLTIRIPPPSRNPTAAIFSLDEIMRPARFTSSSSTAQEAVTYLHVPAMPQLERLNVHWDEPRSGPLSLIDPRMADSQIQPADFSALRQLVLLRGVRGIGVVLACRDLRVLVLHVPASLGPADLFRVIQDNPHLQRLELFFPMSQRGDAAGDLSWEGSPLATRIERMLLGEYSQKWGGLQTLQANPVPARHVQYLTARLDCSRIRLVECNAHITPLDQGLFLDIMDQLQDITLLDEYHRQQLRVCDSQGFVRRLSGGVAGPFLLDLFPLLVQHLRALRISATEWRTLSELEDAFPELRALEELFLKGSFDAFVAVRPVVSCPRLGVLTLCFETPAPAFVMRSSEPDPTEDQCIRLATMLAEACFPRQLQRLNVLRLGFTSREETHIGSYPGTVYVGSTTAFPSDETLADSEEDFQWSTAQYLSRP